VHGAGAFENVTMTELERVFQEATSRSVDLDALIEAVGSELFHYALVITGSRSRAEDVVQDVFVALLERRRSLRSVRNPRSWLFTVLRNIAFRSQEPGERGLAREIFETVEGDPAERLILQEVLQALPSRSQEIVLLHVWEGLTFTEISEVLGIPRGTALSSYHRSMALLRTRFGGSYESYATKGSDHA
jgi:RNA polymerase sigma-70 factor (ECF subfamily)